ncbi:MAG: mannose-1-phosphate guanylyltransferase/mannose-6-phosphate isomerase [Gammaproteobacteria bacterium]|nr:mannose-1-phosphate guanylyltransferase/mannose-6-phosphate isomerase [Gammaproteobacteria bacterium]MDE0224797.1 mannose-1-phosphate guanylyltransferase/mannose-6-phosphate isomerase [Gammaproteobacteria bacterium]MDE0451315.1 mannose-1-phosphate guanylyltransferase/mannose-6-phosphate isomerase [Gammaproteobacteria bacterium]
MESILPVVLAGGSGTRLWPLSRGCFPKHFLSLTSDRSMLQETLLRVARLDAMPPYIVCNEEHRFLVAEHCREIARPCGAILLESVACGTAPAAGLAACHARERGLDPVLLIVPSDHHIELPDAFCATVRSGLDAAGSGQLVAFGVQPSSPDTGYGYIRAGESLDGGLRRVAQFFEKPDSATAVAYVESGDFYWNSGIFLCRASTYLEQLGRYQPEMLASCQAAVASGSDHQDFFRPGPEFADSPNDSIDYGIMEKTESAVMLPLDVGWSDVGSWSALHGLRARNEDNNAIAGDVITLDTKNSLVQADKRLVVTVGVDGLMVVDTADAVLIAGEGHTQKVKEVVGRIKDLDYTQYDAHTRVNRPWGSYEVVEAGEHYQVKKISVNPGARLSLQAHQHRSEHWIVVRGTAEVTRGDATLTLSANESTYIPLGSRHRISNPGTVPMELIEVQVGDYLGEDDIVRFDDDYERADEESDPS